MDVLFELIFAGLFDQLFGQLFGGGTRRKTRRLREVLNRAQATGQPLACEVPVSFHIHHPGKIAVRGWKRGVLRIEPSSLTWAPRNGDQPRDLTGSKVIKDIPTVVSSNTNLNSHRLIINAADGRIELAVRNPFLPFVHVGLKQTRAESLSSTRKTRSRTGCQAPLTKRPDPTGYIIRRRRAVVTEAVSGAAAHTESMSSSGTVREWDDDQGWGVIDSADTPGGCWCHFSNIVVPDGLATLRPGDHVTFTHEAPGQDGFSYRAVLVWPPGVRSGTPQRSSHQGGASTAYRSRLTIRWADGTVTEGIPERKRGK